MALLLIVVGLALVVGSVWCQGYELTWPRRVGLFVPAFCGGWMLGEALSL